MKNIAFYLFIFSGMIATMACNNQGFKKTKSGLLYKIVSDGKSEMVKRGEFLKINIVEKVRDSVLFTSYGGVPIYLRVDSAIANYSPSEVFPLLHKGDSAVIIQLVDSLMKKSAQLPPFFRKKDKLTYLLKVTDVFKSEDLVNRDRDTEVQKEKQKESKVVEDYLAGNKINAQKTAKGTYVEVKSVGDGPAVDSGKQVSVLYTGKLFPSGKVFESNMSGPNTQPIKFVIGARGGGMIQGWDDGLRLFKKGGKGTLYIPAFLGYDARPGPGGKSYENMIFDVQIVDVTDAPKQPARPSMPQQENPQNANPKEQH